MKNDTSNLCHKIMGGVIVGLSFSMVAQALIGQVIDEISLPVDCPDNMAVEAPCEEEKDCGGLNQPDNSTCHDWDWIDPVYGKWKTKEGLEAIGFKAVNEGASIAYAEGVCLILGGECCDVASQYQTCDIYRTERCPE